MKINKKFKLGIIGHGFVGKATDWGFNKHVSKFIVDPLLNTTISDLKEFKPEIVFICVPTPMSDDGSIDSSIIEALEVGLSVYQGKALVNSVTGEDEVLERVLPLVKKLIAF